MIMRLPERRTGKAREEKVPFSFKIRVLLRNNSIAKELIIYGSFQSGTEQRLCSADIGNRRENPDTSRTFSVTDVSREQIEAAGYGVHHQSAD